MGKWLNELRARPEKVENAYPSYRQNRQNPSEPGSVSFVSTPTGRSPEISNPPNVDRASDDLNERSALVEYGAGVPRAWAEGFARLDLAHPPAGFSARQWAQLVDDGGRFLDRWAAEAAAAGWDAADVFGVHIPSPRTPTTPWRAWCRS